MKSTEFTDRTAIVTGAASGIGRATCLELLAHGLRKITIVDVNEAGLKSLADELMSGGATVEIAKADVSQGAEVQGYVQRTTERFGGVDHLFNNAGIGGFFGDFVDLTEQDFDKITAINFKGIWLNLHHVLPVMLAKKRGTIVNTASITSFRPFKNLAVYSSIKWAVAGLTKAVAGEIAGSGVRVNAVAPGVIGTELVYQLERQGYNEQQHGLFIPACPEGRYGTPEEIAKVVRFLMSDDASYTQGAIYLADGGIHTSA